MIIQGIGLWLPEKKRLNSDWPASFGKSKPEPNTVPADRVFNDLDNALDEDIARATEPFLIAESRDPFLGVKERRVADPGETVARSAGLAAKRALEDAGLRPEDVDVVVSFASVPDYIPSQCAASVAKEIGCHDGLFTLDINAGCGSDLVGLEVCQKMIQDDDRKVALLVLSSLLTRLQPMMHPACPSFGDAAGALVLTSRPHGLTVRSVVSRTCTDFADSVVYLRSNDPSQAKWFEASDRPLYLGSREKEKARTLFRDTVSYIVQTVEEAAAKAGIKDAKDLDLLVCTQPRGYVPLLAAQFLGMPRDAAICTYEKWGHTTCVSVIMNLFEAKQRGLLEKPGTTVGCYSQGVGFVKVAAILEVVPPP